MIMKNGKIIPSYEKEALWRLRFAIQPSEKATAEARAIRESKREFSHR
jgi:hypothetical protein